MTIPRRFSVTWDYRCPFARNAHLHLLAGLEAGAPWDVTFTPFFLDEVHAKEHGHDAWNDPDHRPNLDPLAAAVVVRDRMPERFPAVHRALFLARHDEGVDLRDRSALAGVLDLAGVDAAGVLEEVDTGAPGAQVRREHEASVVDLDVFGVPTFIVGDRAVFVRLMSRPGPDPAPSVAAIDQILDLITGSPDLNEFKYTRVTR